MRFVIHSFEEKAIRKKSTEKLNNNKSRIYYSSIPFINRQRDLPEIKKKRKLLETGVVTQVERDHCVCFVFVSSCDGICVIQIQLVIRKVIIFCNPYIDSNISNSISFSFSIADSFVNSQEWTISRSVPELRLGIVGSLNSGKSALVHRYLTGSYMQEESPEGGRFKKEIFIDNQSYLLLIRDEGGLPEMQVC